METMSLRSESLDPERLISEKPALGATAEAREQGSRSIALAGEVVRVTERASRPPLLYAPAAVRDRFLASLDAGDWKTTTDMAKNLTECGNPLPGVTCSELNLPAGSSYGAAAKSILGIIALEQPESR